MNKEKVGSILFWLAVIWIFLWGIIGSLSLTPAYRNLTTEEIYQTMWAPNSIWFMIWGIYGVALGAIIALFGIMLNSGAKVSTALIYGIGLVLIMFISMMLSMIGHIPILFGIGGTIILLCFVSILRMWAKERMALKDKSSIALDFRLIGYTFFLLTAWFTCGVVSMPFLKAVEGIQQGSPIHVLIFFTLGWLFLCLSYYKEQKE